MKKLLYLSCLLITMSSQAQDYWTEFSTLQPVLSTGISSISMVDVNTTWLNMRPGTSGAASIRRYTKTTNGGNTWATAAIDLGTSSPNLAIGNIHGVSSSVAYASVYPTATATVGGVWKTTDGGTTWARQASAAFTDASFIDLVYFWNANDGVALGDASNGYFEIYTTSDGGDNWTRVPASPALIPIDPQEYGVINNFTTYGNTIWAGTAFGRILKSSDRGMTWTAIQSPIADFGDGINGNESGEMAFTDENNGLLMSSDFQLYSTIDGGITWIPFFCTGYIRNFDIAAVPGMPDTYVSIGEDINLAERGSSYSIDGGLNWIDINNNPDTVFVDGAQLAMLDEEHGFAGGFTQSSTLGGVFRWGGGPLLRMAHLAVSIFSDDMSVAAVPNPTSGTLNITGKNISQIVVYDLLGKEIAKTNYTAVGNAMINLDYLANGAYIVKVINDKGISVIKVVKQ